MDPHRQSDLEPLDPVVIEALRCQTPAQRLEAVNTMWRTARRLVTAGVRTQHPDWGDDRIDREVAKRMACGSASAE